MPRSHAIRGAELYLILDLAQETQLPRVCRVQRAVSQTDRVQGLEQ